MCTLQFELYLKKLEIFLKTYHISMLIIFFLNVIIQSYIYKFYNTVVTKTIKGLSNKLLSLFSSLMQNLKVSYKIMNF